MSRFFNLLNYTLIQINAQLSYYKKNIEGNKEIPLLARYRMFTFQKIKNKQKCYRRK